jgi:uncharacterized protein YaaN involved in tellurite resistance
MKKIITLCIFAIILMFSVQNMSAQNTIEINAEANIKTKELRKTVKFEDTKMNDVYKAYQSYGVAYKKISNSLSNKAERLKKINTVLDEELKTILSAEEYITYLQYSKNK